MKYIVVVISLVSAAISPAAATTPKEIVVHYADLAYAIYEDALMSARQLQHAVNQLIAKPTEENLKRARDAWKAARVPYQQSEAYRFGNAIVDDWEGRVNAWPLDEGLIDYVSVSYGEHSDMNDFYAVNIIASKEITLAGKSIDVSEITASLLTEVLHGIDEVESNVATGYHAIEFLLWGQDLNGTGPGAGERPASDYDVQQCRVGHCQRRAQYLRVVTALLVDDLTWMVKQWGHDGQARGDLLQLSVDQAVAAMLKGIGSLSYGELAGERMKLGLLLHDPEEEHDCFSDNTHAAHFNNALGIKNVYTGSYRRINGQQLKGPSLSEWVAGKDTALNQHMLTLLDSTLNKMQVLVHSAEQEGVAYDQLIAEGNQAGNAKVEAAIEALIQQTQGIESVVKLLELGQVVFEDSESLH